MEKEWISASDVEKFGYCPLSWWLSREKKVENETLKEGKDQHKEIGEELGNIKEKENRLKLLENLVLGIAIASTIISIFGMTLITTEDLFARIFIIIALIWLLSATFFLYISEKHRRLAERIQSERIVLIFAMIATMFSGFSFTLPIRDELIAQTIQVVTLSWLIVACYWLQDSLKIKGETKRKKEEMDIENSEIKYVDDLEEESELLKSEKHRLRGRPDLVLEKEGKPVPVEVKTGRVPEGPFFSHILQIAAYCLLIEEDMGTKPPYGLIRYGETEFDIDYDEDLRELLLEKLDDMREHIEEDEAHRNHNREGKCRNCSRRKICDEALV